MRPLRVFSSIALFSGAVLFAQEEISAPGRLWTPSVSKATAEASVQAIPPSAAAGLSAGPEHGMAALAQSERTQDARFGAATVGKIRDLDPSVMSEGQWTRLDDGRWSWRLALRSEGATGVRVHFQNFDVGAGKVWLDADGDRVQVFTGTGLYKEGEFWAATVKGAVARVEFVAEGGARLDAVPFRIDKVGHTWADIFSTEIASSPAIGLVPFPKAQRQMSDLAFSGSQPREVAACHLDAACFPELKTVSSGVARILIVHNQSLGACSGALIASRSGSGRPLFLTADHCVADETEARSVQANFFYESESCTPGASTTARLETVLGAQYLVSAAFDKGDFSLIELLGLPGAPVYFFGWTSAEPPIGSEFTGIHHPRGSYKRVSFYERIADDGAIIGADPYNAYAPNDLFYRAASKRGRIQPGSSGSAVLNSKKEIVGTTSYGRQYSGDPDEDDLLVCQNVHLAGFSRFSKALPTLKDHLDDFRPGLIGYPQASQRLPGSSVKFQWSPGIGATAFRLEVGSSRGASNYFSREFGKEVSAQVTGLPTDGRAVWARLWTKLEDNWIFVDNQYLAWTGSDPAPGQIKSPAASSKLEGATVTFTWDPGARVDEFMFDLGSAIGDIDVARKKVGTATSVTISNVPTDGRVLYARLWSRINNEWFQRTANYWAADLRQRITRLDVANRLLYPVSIRANGLVVATVAGSQAASFDLQRSGAIEVTWEMLLPKMPDTGVQMGAQLNGKFSFDAPGDSIAIETTNVVNGRTYYAPVVTNASTRKLLLEVNGTRTFYTLGLGETAAWLGYWELASNSSVKGYYELLGYSGAAVSASDFAAGVQAASGRVDVALK
ncbi:MAG: trypsin-like peptidase domain-containing protein [Bryobacteraceae bacterium]